MRILKITLHEYYFLIYPTLRDMQFYRICFVTGALKYNVYVCSSYASHIRQVSVDSELACSKI